MMNETRCHGLEGDCRYQLEPRAQSTLLDWPLDIVVARWADLLETRAQREWLNGFRLRYLDLEASRPAWEIYREPRARAPG